MPHAQEMLEIENLTVRLTATEVPLIGPVSMQVRRGEILGIVGESGSGKTTLGLAIAGLLATSLSTEGAIRLEDLDLASLSGRELRKIRGHRVTMIFQDPMNALNPVFTIGQQIEAVLRTHSMAGSSKREVRARAVELLARVGISDTDRRHASYPHELSGGMCQRVGIALALATGADLIVADEPTSALDVTVQAQIVGLLTELVRDSNLTVIFVSHDLGLVSQLCDRVAVFYAGELIEIGSAKTVTMTPLHPYTVRLVAASPHLEEVGTIARGIPGAPPMPGQWSKGCRFQDRCALRTKQCETPQSLRHIASADHAVRCHLADGREALQ